MTSAGTNEQRLFRAQVEDKVHSVKTEKVMYCAEIDRADNNYKAPNKTHIFYQEKVRRE